MSNEYRQHRDTSRSISYYQETVIAERVVATSSLELTQSYDCDSCEAPVIVLFLLIFCLCPLGLVGIIPASRYISNVLSGDGSDIPEGAFNQFLFHISKIFGFMVALGILVLFVFIVDVEFIKLAFTIGSLRDRIIAALI